MNFSSCTQATTLTTKTKVGLNIVFVLSCLQPSSIRGLVASRTSLLHFLVSLVYFNRSSNGIPVHSSMLPIHRILGFPWFRNRNRNHKLQTSKAPLKSQAQGTSLFTSAASNQRGFPKNSPWEAQVRFPEGERMRQIRGVF